MKFQDALNQLARETKRAQRRLALERAAVEVKISELVGRYLASRDQAGA